jgi:hypothetical protein
MPPSYSWLKLYYEILDDPKMGRLPDRLWRRVIECFLLAGKNGNSGSLPDVGAMAWALRMDEKKLEEELSQISKVGILEKIDGKWHVKNFIKRQAATPATERMSQMRLRNGYENVTDRIPESDIDIEEEGEAEGEGGPAAKKRSTPGKNGRGGKSSSLEALAQWEREHGRKPAGV